MPSVIGVDSLSGVDIAANYRKQIVPFSRFGTRKIAWFRVGHVDTNDGGLDMEVLNTVVDAIQTKGEVVTVGAPYINNGWGKFVVGLFEDTFNNGEDTALAANGQVGYNGASETLATAIENALISLGRGIGNGDVEVQQIYMFGAPWQDNFDNSGWTADSDYAEPDTKTDFNNGPYG